MAEQTTITVPKPVKAELDEERSEAWGAYLLGLKRDSTDTVRIEDEQVKDIARKTAKKIEEYQHR